MFLIIMAVSISLLPLLPVALDIYDHIRKEL